MPVRPPVPGYPGGTYPVAAAYTYGSPTPPWAPLPAQPGRLRTIKTPGLIVQIFLGIGLVAGVVRLVAETRQYSLVLGIADRPRSFDQAEADASDQFVFVTTTIWNVVVLVTGIVFVVWFFRLRRNAGVWAPQAQRLGQGAAIWGWLPVVNFWIPFQIAQDALAATRPPASSDRSGRGVLRFWWVMWILMVVVGFINRLQGQRLDTIDELRAYLDALRTYTAQSMVLTVVSLVAAVAAILAVRLLTTAQEGRLRASGPGPFAGNPSGGR